MRKKLKITNKNFIVLLSLGLIIILFLPTHGYATIKDVRWGFHSFGFRLVIQTTKENIDYKTKKVDNTLQITLRNESISKSIIKRFTNTTIKEYRLTKLKQNGILIKIKLFTANFDYKVYTLSSPTRLVIDIITTKKTQNLNKPTPKPKLPAQRSPDSKAPSITKLHGLIPTKTTKGSMTKHINIYLTPEKDLSYQAVFTNQDFYFNISPTWKVLADTKLFLVISHSQMVLPNISNITIYLNNTPIYTIKLNKTNIWKDEVEIPIPVSHLKPGVNTLSIKGFLRSTEEQCMDIDNPGNWFRIHKESFLYLSYIPKRNLKLKDFPSPYFENNTFHKDKTVFVIPDNWNPEELQSIFEITTTWSLENRYKKIVPKIKKFSEVNQVIADQNNLIYIGTIAKFPKEIKKQFGITKPIKNSLVISGFINKHNLGRLFITSDTAKGVLKATQAILCNQIRKQMKFNKVILPFNTPIPPHKKAKRFKTDITFNELMVGDIAFIGTYSHEDGLFFNIPPNWEIKGTPQMVIQFRHAPGLNSKTSGLTVLLDDVPIKSVNLTKSNVEKGFLTVNLPKKFLKSGYINATFRAYLDLGVRDCNHNYSEAAWCVIDGNSYLHIPHNIREMALIFDNLPFAFAGRKLNIFISKKTHSSVLNSICYLLMGWQKQLLHHLDFEVFSINKFDLSKNETTSIIIAPAEDIFKMGINLYVKYNKKTKSFVSGEKVPIIPAFARQALLFNIVPINKKPSIIITWENNFPNPTRKFIKALWKSELKGDLSLISAEGEVISFYVKAEKPPEKETVVVKKTLIEDLLDKIRTNRGTVTIFALSVVGLLIIIILLSYQEWKRNR